MADARAVVAFMLLAFAVPAAGGALEVDVGAGVAIDVAPFGIESAGALAIAAPWVGERGNGQGGLVAAVSISRVETALVTALAARVWLATDFAALYGGIGALFTPGQDPRVMPIALGGLRLEAGRLAFLAPGLAIRITPTGLDTGVWLCALWRL